MNTTFNTLVTGAIAANAVVEFNPAWTNGTGYFDYASEGEFAPQLTFGQCVTFVDKNNRTGLIIGAGAGFGNAVVFQRFVTPDRQPGLPENAVLVGNVPYSVVRAVQRKAISENGWIDGRISDEGMQNLLNCIAPNGVQYVA